MCRPLLSSMLLLQKYHSSSPATLAHPPTTTLPLAPTTLFPPTRTLHPPTPAALSPPRPTPLRFTLTILSPTPMTPLPRWRRFILLRRHLYPSSMTPLHLSPTTPLPLCPTMRPPMTTNRSVIRRDGDYFASLCETASAFSNNAIFLNSLAMTLLPPPPTTLMLIV